MKTFKIVNGSSFCYDAVFREEISLKNQGKFQQIHILQGMLQVQKLCYDYDSYIACKNHYKVPYLKFSCYYFFSQICPKCFSLEEYHMRKNVSIIMVITQLMHFN